jgi:mono/diheme cytochrome c family protein
MKALIGALAVLTLLTSGIANSAEPSGQAVYEKWCLPCHRAGQVGSVQLQQRYKGAIPAVLTERTDLQPALISVLVRKGGQVMPIFRKTEISDVELEALATYLTKPTK